MKVYLITIGDEILIGQIVDTNSAWMGQQLNLNGAHITGIMTVSDEAESIVQALEQGLRSADVVLMTGGLGPTKDDITKKVLAEFTGGRLSFHEPTYQRIERFFKQLGRQPTEAHRLQSYMPDNATLLTNPMGTAPGMWFEVDGKVIVSMPGVPYEMKALMQKEVLPRLKAQYPLERIAHRTLLTAGEGESRIAERIADLEDALPPHIKLAYLPNLGRVRLRLSSRGSQSDQYRDELEQWANRFKERVEDLLFGEEEDRLEAVVGQMLKARGLWLSTAESCTGGYLSHLVTSIPGSSAYFLGGIVAYSNIVKQEKLGVRTATLETDGAVSEATVREMVAGTLQHFGGDIAVAVSGIAGPGGGTPEKPVGTIWLAVGDHNVTEAYLLKAGKDREKNIEYTGAHALNFIRRFLKKHYPASVANG
ncbi:competence/damage-inducible protein A [Phaeodactylibacter xiamenensis]|uniref:competence/damage-inducible protein A n=1 Tax=Phaeodactylibacter xiamenensis TaxID=1524460 RepID=UPI0024A89298|nr:competence/damage-inducible protein A [Phaeodactylibacter xiamenensis]